MTALTGLFFRGLCCYDPLSTSLLVPQDLESTTRYVKCNNLMTMKKSDKTRYNSKVY